MFQFQYYNCPAKLHCLVAKCPQYITDITVASETFLWKTTNLATEILMDIPVESGMFPIYQRHIILWITCISEILFV